MTLIKSCALAGMIIFSAFTCVTAQDANAKIKAAYDALNKRDYTAFTKLVAPDFVEYAAGPEPIKTPQAAIEAYKMFFKAFPDLNFQINDIAGGIDGRYYLKVSITGTNTGAFDKLPPTGKKINVTDVDIIEVNSAGLATSHWSANPNGILSAVGYGSVGNPATGVIAAIYEKFMWGDIKSVLAMCTEDVVFEVHDDVLNGSPTMYKGKEQVTEFFKDLASKISYTKFEPWRFIADGDDVMILVHAEFKHIPTGQSYNTNYVHHFKVVNGKVTSFKGIAEIQQPDMKKVAESNIRELFTVMDAGQTDKFPMYCTADFRISNPFVPEPSPIEAFKGILMTQKTAFPDMKHEIVELTTDGHYVTTRGIFSGTNTGSMMGNPPTGNKVVISFIALDELDASGKIKNRYVQFDNKSFEAQLMGGMKTGEKN